VLGRGGDASAVEACHYRRSIDNEGASELEGHTRQHGWVDRLIWGGLRDDASGAIEYHGSDFVSPHGLFNYLHIIEC
jgi:hypothetical protein